MSKESIKLKYSELNERYKKKSAEGYDVSRVKELVDKAMQYYKNEDYEKAEELLDEAHIALEEAKPSGRITNIVAPIVVLVLLAGVGFFAWNSLQGKEGSELELYDSPQFSIKYPKGWIKIDESKLEYSSEGISSSVVFEHPNYKYLRFGIIGGKPNKVFDLSTKQLAEAYYEEIIVGIYQEIYYKYQGSLIEKKLGTKIKLEKEGSRSLVIDNGDAYEIVGRLIAQGQVLFKVKAVVIIKDHNYYYLIYAGDIGQYSRYETIIDKSIESIKIK